MIAFTTTRKSKKSRHARVKRNEYSQRCERYAHVGTFTAGQDGTVRVTHKEPLLEEARDIQRDQNEQAAATTSPAPEDRLAEIEHELHKRYQIQRFNALEIGKLYCEAKRLLPHGKFVPWINKIGLHKKSAAAAYMRVYRYCLGRPELVENIKPTMLQIICQPSFPADLQEEIFIRNGVNGNVADLMDVAKLVRTKKIPMSDKRVQNLLRDREEDTIRYAIIDIDAQAKTVIENLRRELGKLLPPCTQTPASPNSYVGNIQKRIQLYDKFVADVDDLPM